MTVKFYSTGCPKCKILELKLKTAGVDYEKVSDENEIETIASKANLQSLPFLVIEDKVLDFGQAVNWLKELDKR